VGRENIKVEAMIREKLEARLKEIEGKLHRIREAIIKQDSVDPLRRRLREHQNEYSRVKHLLDNPPAPLRAERN
jgi:hypothetical protein